MVCAECGRALDPGAGTGRPRRYCSRSCQSRAYRRRRDEGRLAGAPRPASGKGQVEAEIRAPIRSRGTEALVEVAIALADADGVGALTLRAVAYRAGLTFAQVRREFRNRDRLLAAVVQHVLSRRHRPGGTPVQTLARLAAEEWAVYRAHPWLVTVVASSRPPLVPAVLHAARASTEAFVALGLDPPTALGRYVALSGYVQGMALLLLAEHGETARTGTAYPSWWSQELGRLDRTGERRRHPWLDDVSGGRLPAAFDADADAWFRDGLDRVLAGLVAPSRAKPA